MSDLVGWGVSRVTVPVSPLLLSALRLARTHTNKGQQAALPVQPTARTTADAPVYCVGVQEEREILLCYYNSISVDI